MVRGRRVRAVVADECCSPHPKRKAAILTPIGKNQTITQFFQVVELNKPDLLDDSNDLDDKEKEVFKEIIVTPKPKRTDLQAVFEELLSPPTPHRIEFNEEEPPPQPKKEEKKIVPAPRAKKRLNQLGNQQVPIKPEVGNHKLTEYFPVRRSVRKTNKVVLEEKQRTLVKTLRQDVDAGLRICNFEGKGRGVIANKLFERGDFVVEYAGDLIDIPEAKRREQKYALDQNTGCYMYYFKHKGLQYCIDATAESGRKGRLVNHSRNGNLITRTIDVDNQPRLILVAKDTIEAGEEVTYDYGDRSKESLIHHPWLAY